jgi:hypothetical protein
MPADWMHWRDRWEHAHAARAGLMIGALDRSVTRQPAFWDGPVEVRVFIPITRRSVAAAIRAVNPPSPPGGRAGSMCSWFFGVPEPLASAQTRFYFLCAAAFSFLMSSFTIFIMAVMTRLTLVRVFVRDEPGQHRGREWSDYRHDLGLLRFCFHETKEFTD